MFGKRWGKKAKLTTKKKSLLMFRWYGFRHWIHFKPAPNARMKAPLALEPKTSF